MGRAGGRAVGSPCGGRRRRPGRSGSAAGRRGAAAPGRLQRVAAAAPARGCVGCLGRARLRRRQRGGSTAASAGRRWSVGRRRRVGVGGGIVGGARRRPAASAASVGARGVSVVGRRVVRVAVAGCAGRRLVVAGGCGGCGPGAVPAWWGRRRWVGGAVVGSGGVGPVGVAGLLEAPGLQASAQVRAFLASGGVDPRVVSVLDSACWRIIRWGWRMWWRRVRRCMCRRWTSCRWMGSRWGRIISRRGIW